MPAPVKNPASQMLVIIIAVALVSLGALGVFSWLYLSSGKNSTARSSSPGSVSTSTPSAASGSSQLNSVPPTPMSPRLSGSPTPPRSELLPPQPQPQPQPQTPPPPPAVSSISVDDALQQLNTKSYLFQATLSLNGNYHNFNGIFVQQRYLTLMDTGNRFPVSMFVDLKDGRTTLILHKQKQARILSLDKKILDTSPEEMLLLSYAKAFRELSALEPKDALAWLESNPEYHPVEGVSAREIRLIHRDGNKVVSCNLSVDLATRLPVLLNINVSTIQESRPYAQASLSHSSLFDIDENTPVSFPVPSDYTVIDLTAAPRIELPAVDASAMTDGQKLQAALDQWDRKEKDKAVAFLLAVDWNKRLDRDDLKSIFSPADDHSAAGTATRAQPNADRDGELAKKCQALSDYICELSKAMENANQLELAEKCLQNTWLFGKLLDMPGQADPLRRSGTQIQISTLTRLIEFYGNQNEVEKKLVMTRRLAILRDQLSKSPR